MSLYKLYGTLPVLLISVACSAQESQDTVFVAELPSSPKLTMVRFDLYSAGAEEPKPWFTPYTLFVLGGTAIVGEIVRIEVARTCTGQKRKNQVQNSYALGVDKPGHALEAYAAVLPFYFGYKATGLPDQAARWWAFGSTVAVAAYSEYWQGYAPPGPDGEPLWGSDWQDVAFDALGAGLFVAQGYWSELKRLQIRWSITGRDRQRYPYDSYTNLWNDYQGQVYWLTIRIGDLVGWDPLCLAVGENVTYPDDQGRIYRQVWLSLDIDWVEWQGDKWWTQVLNRVKFPISALVVSSAKAPWISPTSWK